MSNSKYDIVEHKIRRSQILTEFESMSSIERFNQANNKTKKSLANDRMFVASCMTGYVKNDLEFMDMIKKWK